MSDKFSVGPWKVVDTVEPLYVLDGKGYDVCRMATIEPREENEANARLISASRDMIDAIEAELRYYDIQARVDQGEEGVTQFDADRAGSIAMSLMRSALRKARGDDD